MPAYGSSSTLTAIYPGDITTVWNGETPAAGNGGASASVAVALSAIPGHGPSGFSVDGKFSGAPGVFEVDVQVAEVDADANYQTVAGGNIAAVDAVNNTFHLDGANVAARFVRLLMRARANNVSIIATVLKA